MTQEKMQLLTVDLSSRLPYGVMLRVENDLDDSYDVRLRTVGVSHMGNLYVNNFCVGDGYSLSATVKPYLRPLSSMTEEEKSQYNFYLTRIEFAYDASLLIDWLNKNMFDYRGLIDKGLALEAPKEMYKEEER